MDCILQYFCLAEIPTKKKTKHSTYLVEEIAQLLCISAHPMERQDRWSLPASCSDSASASLVPQPLWSCWQVYLITKLFMCLWIGLLCYTIHMPVDVCNIFHVKTLSHIKWWQHHELYDFWYQIRVAPLVKCGGQLHIRLKEREWKGREGETERRETETEGKNREIEWKGEGERERETDRQRQRYRDRQRERETQRHKIKSQSPDLFVKVRQELVSQWNSGWFSQQSHNLPRVLTHIQLYLCQHLAALTEHAIVGEMLAQWQGSGQGDLNIVQCISCRLNKPSNQIYQMCLGKISNRNDILQNDLTCNKPLQSSDQESI